MHVQFTIPFPRARSFNLCLSSLVWDAYDVYMRYEDKARIFFITHATLEKFSWCISSIVSKYQVIANLNFTL